MTSTWSLSSCWSLCLSGSHRKWGAMTYSNSSHLETWNISWLVLPHKRQDQQISNSGVLFWSCNTEMESPFSVRLSASCMFPAQDGEKKKQDWPIQWKRGTLQCDNTTSKFQVYLRVPWDLHSAICRSQTCLFAPWDQRRWMLLATQLAIQSTETWTVGWAKFWAKQNLRTCHRHDVLQTSLIAMKLSWALADEAIEYSKLVRLSLDLLATPGCIPNQFAVLLNVLLSRKGLDLI